VTRQDDGPVIEPLQVATEQFGGAIDRPVEFRQRQSLDRIKILIIARCTGVKPRGA
jgi:hypothetical protein